EAAPGRVTARGDAGEATGGADAARGQAGGGALDGGAEHAPRPGRIAEEEERPCRVDAGAARQQAPDGAVVGRVARERLERRHSEVLCSPSQRRNASNQTSLCWKPGKLAFSPLGFGRTNVGAPASRSGLAPGPGVAPRGNTRGYKEIPTRATARGRYRATLRASVRAPASSSEGASSEAEREGRGQRFVMPRPWSGSER